MEKRLGPQGLLGWLAEPVPGKGLYTFEDDGWTLRSYQSLARRVCGVSAQLQAEGVRADDVVALADKAPDDFLTAFFGVLQAGATPLPVAAAGIVEGQAQQLNLGSGPAVAAAIHGDAAPVDSKSGINTVEGRKLIRLTRDEQTLFAPTAVPSVALVQRTSGSTGTPKHTLITRENIEANVAMICAWLNWTDDDVAASWLPLYHDMGLIGLMITAVCTQTSLYQLTPAQFMFQPIRWLECFGSRAATITAAPTSGYAYAARRVRGEQLEGLDFAGWRNAVVGAERITGRPLVNFCEMLRPNGFRPETLRPAYGLAEATLAVTGTRFGSSPRFVQVGSAALAIGQRIEVRDLPIRGPDRPTQPILGSCGSPLDEVTIAIVDNEGRELPEETLGEVSVRGPSVASGYAEANSGLTRFMDDVLLTGDAGFVSHGELFVLGRVGDSIKVRGLHLHAETVETIVSEALEMPAHKCIVVPDPMGEDDGLAVLLETEADAWTDENLQTVRASVGREVPVSVYALGDQNILRTTSGKPRRKEMWQRLLDGGFGRNSTVVDER